MSNRRHIVVEFEGSDVAFAEPNITGASLVVDWGAPSFLTGIQGGIPPSQQMAVDPFDGSWRSSGLSVMLTKEAGLLLSRKTLPITLIDEDFTAFDTTMDVVDTTAFPSSGFIWVGAEAMSYSGKTATSFTGILRGQLGTVAAAHDQTLGLGNVGNRVFGFNPFLLGRACQVWRFDPDDPVGTRSKRFIGHVDGFHFDSGGFSIPLINGNKLIEDAVVMPGRFAQGITLSPIDSTVNTVQVYVENERYKFKDPRATDHPDFFQVEDEIIRYLFLRDPDIIATVCDTGDILGTVTCTGPSFTAVGYYFEPDYNQGSSAPFQRGDEIEFVDDATSETIRAKVTLVEVGTHRVFHDANGKNPAANATVQTTMRQSLEVLLLGQAETRITDHPSNSDIKEIRIVEGNHIDCILQMMLSVSGDQTNSDWDILPAGYGAGILQDFVDIPAFLALKDYATDRRFVFDRPESLVEHLKNLARITSSRIFWREDGILSATAERDVYPDTALGIQAITSSVLSQGAIPRWGGRLQNVRNYWVTRGNAPASEDDFRDEATFQVEESVTQFGVREMAPYEDRGLVLARAASQLEVVATAVLLRWAENNPFLEVVIELQEAAVFRPGSIVSVTVPHLPNLDGTYGLSNELFEVLEYQPQDNSNTATLLMAQMPRLVQTALVAPCAQVASAAGAVLTLEPATTTFFAPTTATLLTTLIGGGDGTDDVDWFFEDDNVTLWDASSLGGAPAVHNTTIDSINYGTRQVTLAAAPSFTAAAGDLLRLSTFTLVNGGLNASLRVPYFIVMADPDNVPITLPSNTEPKVWGL